MNDPRRDRKILVTVGLSGSQVARAGHWGFGYTGLARRGEVFVRKKDQSNP